MTTSVEQLQMGDCIIIVIKVNLSHTKHLGYVLPLVQEKGGPSMMYAINQCNYHGHCWTLVVFKINCLYEGIENYPYYGTLRMVFC